MNIPLVRVPNGNLGWQGGESYLSNLKAVLSELENEGKIKLLPSEDIWLKKRFPFAPVANKENPYGVFRNLSNVVFLPWAPMRRVVRPLIWIPDLQDVDMPYMFDRKEIAIRDRNRRIAISRKACFYFSSESMEKRFLQVYPDAISVGVVRFTYKDFFGNQSNMPKQNLPAGSFFYVPNQYWKHKNHLILLDAFEKYKRTGGINDLVLSGSTQDPRWPEYSKKLIERARQLDGVHELGHIPRNSQIDLFRNSISLIQPSIYEGWSSSIEEAVNFSLPIIATDIPVIREQTEGLANVWLFDPTDSDFLASLMHQAALPVGKRDSNVSNDRWRRFKSDLYQMISLYLEKIGRVD